MLARDTAQREEGCPLSPSLDSGTFGDDSQDYYQDGDAPGGLEGYEVQSKYVTASFERINIMSKEEVGQEMMMVVEQLSEVIPCVGLEDLMHMLHTYNWDVGKLQEEWFSDSDAVRKSCGVPEQPVGGHDTENPRCLICFEEFLASKMMDCGCGHAFCMDCWNRYVKTEIESGPRSLDLRCPTPDCSCRVKESILKASCDQHHLEMLNGYSVDKYIQKTTGISWCPGPDCGRAVQIHLLDSEKGVAKDIHCRCGHDFCFACREEAHRPVDCKTVKMWLIKNSSESENMQWILANTKPCPRCARPIEKHQGCMHMTCFQCRFEFCWLCLGDWRKHGNRTGGFYQCNIFRDKTRRGETLDDEIRRINAKVSNERYLHHWERWAEHDKALKIVKERMEEWENSSIEVLSERHNSPASNYRFVTEAWREVMNCRRILKWTYASGYYSFDEHHSSIGDFVISTNTKCNKRKLQELRDFFEFAQNDAENALERITHKMEKQLPLYLLDPAHLGKECMLDSWDDFRKDLIGLTDVTRTQFARLITFLENGVDRSIEQMKMSTTIPDSGLLPKQEARALPSNSLVHINPGKEGMNCVSDEAQTHKWVCVRCNMEHRSRTNTCSICGQKCTKI